MKLRLFLILLIFSAAFSGCGKSEEYSQTIIAMDTPMTITAWGDGAEDAVKAAEKEINRLDGLFSVTNENSEIYKLNKDKSLKVSEDTYDLISSAENYGEFTGGALNIAIYPVVREWGFTTGEYKVPDDSKLDELKNDVDSSEINIDEASMTVSLGEKTEIDLGAAAKGYTSQKIMDIFKDMGVEAGLVSLGGNVQCMGEKPDGALWTIAVADPENEEDYVGLIKIDEGAVVTSGSYQRYFEENGKRYHHIMDSATCRPAENDLSSVTIVSEDGEAADAFSTALFVMGREKATAFWRENKDQFDAVFITKEGKVYITEGLKANFAPRDGREEPEIIYSQE